MSIFRTLYMLIKNKYVNTSNSRRVNYLKKCGAVIGVGTRLNCNTKSFGTEPFLIAIGENCLLSSNVQLITHDGGVKVLNSMNYFDGKQMDKMGKIIIGNNVYIGFGAYIMPGVQIGDNVIIGAGSIVTHDIPSNTCAVGIPAKVKCTIDDYYKKNIDLFLDTENLSVMERKDYIIKHLH